MQGRRQRGASGYYGNGGRAEQNGGECLHIVYFAWLRVSSPAIGSVRATDYFIVAETEAEEEHHFGNSCLEGEVVARYDSGSREIVASHVSVGVYGAVYALVTFSIIIPRLMASRTASINQLFVGPLPAP